MFRIDSEVILEKECKATLHELACDFAERVLPLYEKNRPGDRRPRRALEARRREIKGEIDEASMKTIRAGLEAAINAAAKTRDDPAALHRCSAGRQALDAVEAAMNGRFLLAAECAQAARCAQEWAYQQELVHARE